MEIAEPTFEVSNLNTEVGELRLLVANPKRERLRVGGFTYEEFDRSKLLERPLGEVE